MIATHWYKCGKDGHYCSLLDLDLSTVTESGVYVIWHEGNPARVVRLGQGDVAARLSAHRNDSKILAYAKQGKLRVTWAKLGILYFAYPRTESAGAPKAKSLCKSRREKCGIGVDTRNNGARAIRLESANQICCGCFDNAIRPAPVEERGEC